MSNETTKSTAGRKQWAPGWDGAPSSPCEKESELEQSVGARIRTWRTGPPEMKRWAHWSLQYVGCWRLDVAGRLVTLGKSDLPRLPAFSNSPHFGQGQ